MTKEEKRDNTIKHAKSYIKRGWRVALIWGVHKRKVTAKGDGAVLARAYSMVNATIEAVNDGFNGHYDKDAFDDFDESVATAVSNRSLNAVHVLCDAYLKKTGAMSTYMSDTLFRMTECEAWACDCHAGARCDSPGKHPIMPNWLDKPIGTGLDVDMMWHRNPNANIAILTGPESGVSVLDCDVNSEGTLTSEVVGLYRKFPKDFNTPMVKSGGGGLHLYYNHPQGVTISSKVRTMPGLDVRANRSSIIAPPSQHVSGEFYKWDDDLSLADTHMIDFPPHFQQMVKRRKADKMTAFRGREIDLQLVPTIQEGERNDRIHSIVGRLISEKHKEDDILRLISEVNRTKCTPPLGETELNNLVRLSYRRYA